MARWRKLKRFFGFCSAHLIGERRGADVSYHDPYVAQIPKTREHPEFAGRRSVPLDAGTIGAFDAVVVATDHDSVDYAAVSVSAKLIIDTRNVFARNGLATSVVLKA